MTDLSALTKDELLNGHANARTTARLAMYAHELRRRLSAGEQAEKDIARLNGLLLEKTKFCSEIIERADQAEARVAELERERDDALAKIGVVRSLARRTSHGMLSLPVEARQRVRDAFLGAIGDGHEPLLVPHKWWIDAKKRAGEVELQRDRLWAALDLCASMAGHPDPAQACRNIIAHVRALSAGSEGSEK